MSDGAPIRLVLVDDQPMLRMGFRMVLDAQTDMEVVGEAGDGEAAVRCVAELRPDVVLMDVRMPVLDGVEATARITADVPGVKVLILTTFDLDEYVVSGLRAGASGFLLKDVPPTDLLSAIRVVAAGDAVVAPSVTKRLLDRFVAGGVALPVHDEGVESLTPREREVLVLMARGLSNGELAARLYLSEATVKTHVAHILDKLQVRDRVQAVVRAYDAGLVRAGETLD